MAGETKVLTFSEGVSVTAPSQSFLSASSLETYANDAAFVAAKGGAATEGDIYGNTTDNLIHYYNGSSWVDVVDESTAQDLINKSLIDASTTFKDDGDNTKQFKLQISSVSTGTTRTWTVPDVNSTFLGTDASQVVTNKDIDGGTASNTSRITIPKDTKTNLDGLARKEGTLVYASDLNTLFADDGATLQEIGAGGTGGINYIDNSDAEINTDGWATYADAAGTTPVDGTGGSPNITWTRSTSNPLQGSASFVLTKDAANRQGEGVSYDFSLTQGHYAEPQKKRFYCLPDSNYVDESLEVFIYDVTNTALIPCTPSKIKKTTLTDRPYFEFQTSADGASYRAIFHINSTTATAYTVKFDHVEVGPSSEILTGESILGEDMVRLEGQNGHGAVNTKIRRFNSAVVNNSSSITYADTANDGASFTIERPGVYSISYSDASNTAGNINGISLNSTQLTTNIDTITTADCLILKQQSGVNSQNSVTWAGYLEKDDVIRPHGRGGADHILGAVNAITFTIVRTGDANNESGSGRVVACSYYGTTSTHAVSAVLPFFFDTKVIDTHAGASTGGSGSFQYTFPEPGIYSVSVNAIIGATTYPRIFIDGVEYRRLTRFTSDGIVFDHAGSALVDVTAGQVLDIRANSAQTQQSDSANSIHIFKVQGPSQVLAGEKIEVEYSGNAAEVITTNDTDIPFANKAIDSHAAWDGDTFTAPVAAYYSVIGHVDYNSTTTRTCNLYKNGALNKRISDLSNSSSHHFSGRVYLEAGEYFTIRSTGGTLDNTSTEHWISIVKE